jgi:integrase
VAPGTLLGWYVKYRDADGAWKMRASGQPTKELAKRFLGQIESRIAGGKVGIKAASDAPLVGELMTTWSASIINRNADDDRSRLEKHLRPAFGKKRLPDVNMRAVLDWIDELRKAKSDRTGKTLSEASIRHAMNLLSRFFSWCIERGHTEVNPVRQIPQGRRPQQAQKRDVPWLGDDVVVRQLMAALPEPINLMFYLGNRSGLRTGEIAALRMADLGYLTDGIIRVRFSYDGPLKEDKKGTGKMKWVPAAEDAEAVLGDWLAGRRGQGAGPEDLVFLCATRAKTRAGAEVPLASRWYRKEFIEQCWEKAVAALNAEHAKNEKTVGAPASQPFKLTWYQATRHSFTTRLLEAGASLDEVSAALGHSSPVVTRRYYDHFVRKSFSSTLRQPLSESNGTRRLASRT